MRIMLIWWENLMTFLDENNAYLDCVNDEINTTSANGKMISRLLMSVSQNEIERIQYNTKVLNETSTQITTMLETDLDYMIKGNLEAIQLNLNKLSDEYYEKTS